MVAAVCDDVGVVADIYFEIVFQPEGVMPEFYPSPEKSIFSCEVAIHEEVICALVPAGVHVPCRLFLGLSKDLRVRK